MILNYEHIIEAVDQKLISIEPYAETQIQPASYDLRIGPQGITTTDKKLVNLVDKCFIELRPGDMAIVSSLEILKFDASHIARIGLRSKYARKGLYVTTGLQIDPGFEGRLFVGVTNLTPKPIVLTYGDDFLSIEIHKLNVPTKKLYTGPYQGKTELSAEDIEDIVSHDTLALSEVITTLQSLSRNVGELSQKMEKLEQTVYMHGEQSAKEIKFINMHSEQSAKEIKFIKWAASILLGIIALAVAAIGVIIGVK